MHSLYVINVVAIFLPHVRHVGGVGHRLALQKCILGHVERDAFGGDDNDRWTWLKTGNKTSYLFSQKGQQVTINYLSPFSETKHIIPTVWQKTIKLCF